MPSRLEQHLRSSIDISSSTYKGENLHFSAIPSQLIKVIADSSFDRFIPGAVVSNQDGETFVLAGARTVCNHLELSLLPVSNDYGK